MPIMFKASIAGSSWKSAEVSGLAPTRSPDPTNSVFEFVSLRFLIQVARYSAPPAGTTTLSLVLIVPGVVDST
jgi:hypothetical protein